MHEEEFVEIESVNRSDYSSLQISLYFFLLIFFILLNYVTPMRHVNPHKVILGVNQSFGNKNLENIFIDENHQINEIGLYYKAQILNILPLDYELSVLDDGLELVIQGEIDSFFLGKSSEINELQQFFLSNLAILLSQKTQNTKVTTQITLGTSDMKSNDIELRSTLDRIGAITNYLVRSDVDIETIEERVLDNAHNLLAISLKLAFY